MLEVPQVNINTEEATRFLTWVHPPHECLESDRTFLGPTVPSKAPQLIPYHPMNLNTVEGLRAFAVNMQLSNQGINLFYTPAIFTPSSKDKYTRTKEWTSGIHVLWADMDWKDYLNTRGEPDGGVAMSALETLSSNGFPPHVVVSSGQGYHVYWKLSKMVRIGKAPDQTPITQVESRLKWIQQQLKSDSVSDVTRFLRVPGTLNWGNGRSKIYDPPYQCSVLSWEFTDRGPYELSTFPEVTSMSVSTLPETMWFSGITPEPWDDLEPLDAMTKDNIIRGMVSYFEQVAACVRPPFAGGKESWSELDLSVMSKLVKAEIPLSKILYVFTNQKWAIAGDPGSKALKKRKSNSLVSYLSLTYDKACQMRSHSHLVSPTQGVVTPQTVTTEESPKPFQVKHRDSLIELWFMKQGSRGPVWKGVANFYLTPRAKIYSIEDQKTTQLLCTYNGCFGEQIELVLEKECFTSWQNCIAVLPISASWIGDGQDYQSYVTWLMNQEVPTIQGTKVIGWQEDYFITPSGSYPQADVTFITSHLAVEPHIVVKHPANTQDDVNNLLKWLPKLHSSPHVWIILGWFFMAPYAKYVRKQFGGFPLLLIHGQREAGKTTLMNLLSRLWGNTYGELSSLTTPYSIIRTLALTNSVPIFLDEHRGQGSKMLEVYSLLRTAYTGGSVSFGKRRTNTSYSTGSYPLEAPVIVAGEAPFKDHALRDRSIPIRLSATWLPKNPQSKEALKQVHKLGKAGIFLREAIDRKRDLSLALELINHVNNAMAMDDQLLMYSSRLRNNFAVASAGMCLMQHWSNNEIFVPDPIECVKKAMLEEQSAYKESLTHVFLRKVLYFIRKGELLLNSHYTIEKEQLVLSLDYMFGLLQNTFKPQEEDLLNSRQGVLSVLQDEVELSGLFESIPQVRSIGNQSQHCLIVNLPIAKNMGLEIGLLSGGYNAH